MKRSEQARTIRWVVIAILLALDMGTAHYLSRQSRIQDWGVVLAILPVALITMDLVRRSLGNWVAGVGGLLLTAMLVELLPTLRHHISWVYFLQNLAINLLLGFWFGLSLLRQREPLCTSFARLLHPVMHSRLAHYTYYLTQVWTSFFFLMAVISSLLFILAPVGDWSIFANLLTLPLVVAMFVAEYAVRKRVLPPEDQVGLTSAFRSYRTFLAQRAQLNNSSGPHT